MNSNLIASAKINYGSTASYLTEIRGSYFEVDSSGNKVLGTDGKAKEVPFRTEARLTEAIENKLLAVEKIEPHENSVLLFNLGMNVLFIGTFIFLIWFFFIRPIRMAGKGAMSFGKSKARLLAKERNKITFKDVEIPVETDVEMLEDIPMMSGINVIPVLEEVEDQPTRVGQGQ